MSESWKVVINHEEQYSIWPGEQQLPKGFRDVGVYGSREECVRYFIEEVWTDMRPVGLNLLNKD